MSLYVETIRIQKGRVYNITYHNQRFWKTRKEIFHLNDKTDLRSLIKNIPDIPLIKCRVIYDHKIREVQFHPYERKKVGSLRPIFINEIQYDYKSVERTHLKSLYDLRSGADDILIFRNGFLTDAYYANVIVEKNQQYYTPRNPLLKGVMREYLLQRNKLTEANIDHGFLKSAQAIYLINALNPLGILKLKPQDLMPPVTV